MTATVDIASSDAAVGAGLDPVAHVKRVVTRSGTSFGLGMKILPEAQRHAMFAIYAFGREVDDVADEDAVESVKLRELDEWREDVERLYGGTPRKPTNRALLEPVQRFGLPKAEFLALIDGMEMDAREQMRAPDWPLLRLYCRRVAGAIGLLSIPVFGDTSPDAERFAVALGDGFQLTNILRDIDEDAMRDRLYLPRELISCGGLDPDMPIKDLVTSPALEAICLEIAKVARQRYADADMALGRCRRSAMRPALVMMGMYERILDRLMDSGFSPPRSRARLSKLDKVRAAIFKGLLRPRCPTST